jgi:hypothetical protein
MELSISVQPAVYQIANYNVHPAPKVSLEATFPVSLSITVSLVETNLNIELKEGFQVTRYYEVDSHFQAGHIRTLRAGGNCIHFTGLKLSKMGKIKGNALPIYITYAQVNFDRRTSSRWTDSTFDS